MKELELLIPTLFGLEGLCAEELRRLGLPEGIGPNALPGILTRVTTLPELRRLTEELRREAEERPAKEK